MSFGAALILGLVAIDVAIAATMAIMRRRRLMRENERARNEALDVVRRHSLLLASMSHDIRTPLNGVIGMADLLRETPLDAIQREWVDVIAASGEELLSVMRTPDVERVPDAGRGRELRRENERTTRPEPDRGRQPEHGPRRESRSASPRPRVASEPARGHLLGGAETEAPLVLVAEDNEISRTVARALLAKRGLRADMAHNGREAVRMASTNRYAAILMDCQMPELDGYEATRRIRAAEHGRHVPIIAMTAHSMKGDRERCLAAGMDDYLSKPVRHDQLDEAVKRWLSAA
jgi:CheY-like chemotaxis protein